MRRGGVIYPFVLRDELLNGEIFYTLHEAQIVTRAGRTTTPSSLGQQVFVPVSAWPAALAPLSALN